MAAHLKQLQGQDKMITTQIQRLVGVEKAATKVTKVNNDRLQRQLT